MTIFLSFQSFFGRTYNNLSSISECKNNGDCVINKKNRTACKACRLRKCLLVGMSKSGSRYGRRSNWFKIHCLLQEQQQKSTNGNVQTNSTHLPNNYMPAHFLTNLCHSVKHDTQITRSPSDSGASSADPDESNRDGSVESEKTEISSLSSPPVFKYFRSSSSPYVPPPSVSTTNGRISAFSPVVSSHIPITSVSYSTAQPTPHITNGITMDSDAVEQNEPIDLSVKSRKRRRTPSPVLTTFDLAKPAPLDLTLVRTKPLLPVRNMYYSNCTKNE